MIEITLPTVALTPEEFDACCAIPADVYPRIAQDARAILSRWGTPYTLEQMDREVLVLWLTRGPAAYCGSPIPIRQEKVNHIDNVIHVCHTPLHERRQYD
jgi:hypothetical protein